MRETTRKQLTILWELQASAAESGETLNTTSVAEVLHQSKIHGREAMGKSLLKISQIKTHLEFSKRHIGDSMVKWKKVIRYDETLCLADTKHSISPTNTLFLQ